LEVVCVGYQKLMEFLAITWWQWSNLVALRGLLR
jgi:hypothetical protein